MVVFLRLISREMRALLEAFEKTTLLLRGVRGLRLSAARLPPLCSLPTPTPPRWRRSAIHHALPDGPLRQTEALP